jgi:hypothetical protein
MKMIHSNGTLFTILALAVAANFAFAYPAKADDDHRGRERREHEEWREREWREHEEEAHRWRRNYVAVYPEAPPPVIYAPPAVVYAPPPGINLIIPLHIR